jgi:2,4-dienoyl-CoA reductase-like NADH-dependent reductase (Old Yellow Enzyme family)
MTDKLFEPFTIKNVTFKNRLMRSSLGGRMAYYEGYVNDAWKHFEHVFAEGGIGCIISATMTVSEHRWAPIEYAKLSDPKFIPPIREGVKKVHSNDCKYILQLGDPGSHAQSAIFAKEMDTVSSSPGFDLIYGYITRRTQLDPKHIQEAVDRFARSAGYVRDAGCDGVEITISKGYLIHQDLKPGINRRTDEYGGSWENRFRFLKEIVLAVRKTVGSDYLFGVRMSANDYNHLPLNLRTPLSSYWRGNTIKETVQIAKWLKELGVDYLHVSNGYGFINPKENPGGFPVKEVRMFCNSVRHLTTKALWRSRILNTPLGYLTQLGWKNPPQGPDAGLPENFADARALKEAAGMTVISNGGFSRRHQIAEALDSGGCDLVSMARPLLANPDLPNLFQKGMDGPEEEQSMLPFQTRRSDCTHCNRCAVVTTILPVGCYDPSRFPTMLDMEGQVRYICGDPNYEVEGWGDVFSKNTVAGGQ